MGQASTVVKTTLAIPSKRCAAAATSASCSGVFFAMVRLALSDSPIAQNWHFVALFP